MYYVTKKLQDASIAHRLGKAYPHKCLNLHGHCYQFEVTLCTDELDQYDMVIDFGTIKKLFSDWIQENWDHATIVSADDAPLLEFLQKEQQRHYVIPAGQNSTAECMSQFLFDIFSQLLAEAKAELYINSCVIPVGTPLSNGVRLCSVKVWETADSYATFSKD